MTINASRGAVGLVGAMRGKQEHGPPKALSRRHLIGGQAVANAIAHRLGAAITLAVLAGNGDRNGSKDATRPAVAAGIGALCGTLPDLLEPACHPNHRQFFHSVACAGLVGVAWYRLYRWEPQTNSEDLVRLLLLGVGGAFLIHLAMDAFSPKGLPLIGKL